MGRHGTANPLTWLGESRQHSVQVAYTPEVLGPVKACMESPLTELLPIDLSEGYLRAAGSLTQLRPAAAGCRLAAAWREGLTGPSVIQDRANGFEPIRGLRQAFATD
jgi:hypothetical protein